MWENTRGTELPTVLCMYELSEVVTFQNNLSSKSDGEKKKGKNKYVKVFHSQVIGLSELNTARGQLYEH